MYFSATPGHAAKSLAVGVVSETSVVGVVCDVWAVVVVCEASTVGVVNKASASAAKRRTGAKRTARETVMAMARVFTRLRETALLYKCRRPVGRNRFMSFAAMNPFVRREKYSDTENHEDGTGDHGEKKHRFLLRGSPRNSVLQLLA